MARKLTQTPAREPAIGDNSAAVEEADRIQLISIVSKLSAADDAIEAAKAPLKLAQKNRKQIIGLGKAAGFAAWELEARLAEMKRGTREMAEIEARERKHRRWLGIIDADQQQLILGDSAPQEAKDEAHWAGEGYKAGLRLMSSTPPEVCPERFVQAYMKAHERGFIETTAANAPKPKGMSAEEVAEQARKDWRADHEPGTPEYAAAERAAVRRAKESLENLPGDGFELTEEELAAQQGRPSNEEEPVV